MDEKQSEKIEVEEIKLLKSRHFPEILMGVFILIALLKVASSYSGGMFIHDSPYQFLAGDMFWMASEAEGIKHTNNLFERPAFLMKGDTGTYNEFPMGMPIATSELSLLTNSEIFDSLFHLSLFFAFLSIICIYFILRKIHHYLAYFGTPLSLLLFAAPFRYPLNFGAQMSMMNMFFVFASILTFLYLEKSLVFVALGLLNAVGFYVHGRESLVFNIGVVLFFVYSYVAKKFDFLLFKKYCLSVFVTVLAFLPKLPLYFQTSAERGVDATSLFKFCPATDAPSHMVLMSDFGLFQWIIFAGIVLSILMLFKKNNSFAANFLVISFLGILLNSYFCILGNKTTQIRHFFPITLAIFFGITIYILYVNFVSHEKRDKWFPLIICAALLVAVIIYFSPQPMPEYPVSNPYTWEAFKWVQQNVKDNENVLMLYGDNHYQFTMFFLMLKQHDSIEQSDYYSYIQKGILPNSTKVLKGSLGYYFVRVGLFKVDFKGLTIYENASICDYDYVYFNKISNNDVVQQYTRAIGGILVSESKFIPVYENELVVILKNQNKGGACFAEKKLKPV